MYKAVTYTRADLFDKVWTTPLLRLAKEIGVSDVAVGKACRRAGIPLPGRGYWAKNTKERQRPSLPGGTDNIHDIIEFQVFAGDLPWRPKLAAGEREKRKPIEVPETLLHPHTLVKRTLDAVKKDKIENGRLRLDHMHTLDIRVSPTALDRALRLLDALIKASEQESYKWTISADGKTMITCDGESMRVELKERITKEDKPRAPQTLSSRHSAWEPMMPTWPTHEWIPTNELTFYVDGHTTTRAQRTWQDTAHSSLEGRLPDIMAGLPVIAAGVKAKREEREAREQAYAEQAKTAVDRARAQEALRLGRKQLVDSIEAWERAARIRHFCDSIDSYTAQLPSREASELNGWVKWVRQQADLLDPLRRDLSNLRPWEVRVPDHFTGNSSWEKSKQDWWATTPLLPD